MLITDKSKIEISSVLNLTNKDEKTYRDGMIKYIRTYFAKILTKEELDLLDTEKGLALLQAKIRNKLKGKVGNS